MKKLHSFYFTFLIVVFHSYGQTLNDVQCNADADKSRLMQESLVYQNLVNDAGKKVYEMITRNRTLLERSADTIYTLPVIFHVLHVGEPIGTGTNISLSLAQTAINNLNDRYSNVIGNGLDVGIRFCLAARTPDNCFTDGVDRIDASFDSAYVANGICPANQELLQDLGNWPKDDYINIWIVRALCNNGSGGTTTWQFSQYGGITITPGSITGTTLTHEMGHLLGLAHTFAGGETGNCPPDTNCAVDGDGVCDTPPHRQTDCGATEPCSSTGLWDNSRYNYMSYCGTKDRFTQGQKDKMRALILSTAFLNMANGLSCDPSLHAVINKTNADCYGVCNGALTAVALACSTSVFTYAWSTGETTQTISGLCAGTYTVTVTDSANTSSSVVEAVTITQPTPMTININIDTTTCGYTSATAVPSGGIPFDCGVIHPITIGVQAATNNSTSYPAPYGNHVKSCHHLLGFKASELHAAGFISGKVHSAGLNVSVINGTSVYQNWQVGLGPSNPNFTTLFGPQDVNVTTGWNTYSFSTPYDWDGVSDIWIKYCFANDSITANCQTWLYNSGWSSIWYYGSNTINICTDPPSTLNGTTIRPMTQLYICNDSSYYHYSWDNGNTTATATGLTAGPHSVTITDATGCSLTQNFTVPSSVSVNLISGNLVTSCPTSGCSYQWYLNGSPVCSNSPSCTYSGSGSYTVVITDGFGCIYSGSYISLGIEELNNSTAFSIQPNPTSGNFTILLNKLEHAELSVYNTVGEIAYQTLIGRKTVVNNKQFSPGIYFVKVNDGERVFTQKLVIE